MQVGDLVRYKQNSNDREVTGLIGIVIYKSDDDYAVEIGWNDGERHVYFQEHQCFLEVICK